ncbi:hypothetical protein GETHLI_34090 [Geothrix limicola]|uniref:Prepilin-type N-terminal cleavage/methylation domain-containing protein n=1 Tax=Geothrix limicola TaxID=2927978 RepID=A0ABQ5QJN2_9BACT|nr:hypothetical protein [Geothrix limicola]GLH74907.1 hypothetical protein GETHLI_34090 [Geothrix limicola]
MASGCRRSAQRGVSLLELTIALGMAAFLAAVLPLCWDNGNAELAAAHQEIVGSLDQAFTLARARGTDVKVALGKATGAGEHLSVQLGRRIRWGKPAAIPLPPGMDPDPLAARTGESHPIITVTPRRTTLASAWFLNDGTDALCMRLSGHGHLQVLRWRADLKKWTRA